MIFTFIRKRHKSFLGFPGDYFYRYEITLCLLNGAAHCIFYECSRNEREDFRLGEDEFDKIVKNNLLKDLREYFIKTANAEFNKTGWRE